MVIKTVTTFGHQNANHIWSPKPGPHEVSTSRTTFGGKTVTVFGHQNGNRNKQFFCGFENSFGIVLEQFWFSWRTFVCIDSRTISETISKQFWSSFGALLSVPNVRERIHNSSQRNSHEQSVTHTASMPCKRVLALACNLEACVSPHVCARVGAHLCVRV